MARLRTGFSACALGESKRLGLIPYGEGAPMLFVVAITFIAGIALAQQFAVLILGPATVATIIITASGGAIIVDHPWTISLAIVTAVVSLQIGYFSGAIIKQFLTMSRAERSNGLSLNDPAADRRMPS